MLSTVQWVFMAGIVVVVLVLAMWIAAIQRFCKNAVAFIESGNKRSVSLARIAEVEATLTELSDAYSALLASHKKLRSRITMRENRAKAANGADTDLPDSRTDPDGWKRAMRLQLRKEGVLR